MKSAFVSQLLAEAKKYKENLISQGKRPTYHDYEYFKKRLHSESEYGYESELAEILGI